MDVLSLVIGLVGGLAVGVGAGFIVRKSFAEKKLGSAEEQAKHIIQDAIKNAETTKKEAIFAAKDEIFQMKKEADFDVKERRKEVSRQERRLAQKEETLDAKIESLEKKEEALQEKRRELESLKEKTDATLQAQIANLERIAGLNPNPTVKDINEVEIAPDFLENIDFAEASFEAKGEIITVYWKREDGKITLTTTIPEHIHGKIILPGNYKFENKEKTRDLLAGKNTYIIA